MSKMKKPRWPFGSQPSTPPVPPAPPAADATPPEADAPPATDPSPAADTPPPSIEIDDFLDDWFADIPVEAEHGQCFSTTVRDRWHGKTYDVPGGTHHVAEEGWAFTFENGRFIQAQKHA